MANLHIEPVRNLDAPEFRLYRTLKRSQEHEQDGVFVATNVQVVQRLFTSRFPVVSALLTPAWLEKLEPQLRARPEADIRVYVAEKELIETISGFQVHQGALAVGRIPERASFESLLAAAPAPRLIVAVEGVANAENLGAIIRNCAAFGAHFLVVGETCCSPYLRRAVSSSMGAIFVQSLVQVENLAAKLVELRTRGVRCYAANPRPGSKAVAAADLSKDCCLVFGAEGPGLSAATVTACDESLEIPMATHVDSLNVASATATFLYEANRQRALP